MTQLPVVDVRKLRLICARYGIASLEIFGSAARGESGPDSDIDVLYELKPGARLGWEVEDLNRELTGLFGRRVDLVSKKALHPCCATPCSPSQGPCMQRDRLFVEEMIAAAERARELTAGVTLTELENDGLRREALLSNFTVLGEAASKVSKGLKARHPEVGWRRPADTRNRIIHGYWSIDLEILSTPRLMISSAVSSRHSGPCSRIWNNPRHTVTHRVTPTLGEHRGLSDSRDHLADRSRR